MIKRARVFETVPAECRFLQEAAEMPFIPEQKAEMNVISVFPEREYQEILGFGGAFTESAGYVYAQLGAADKKRLIEAYFDPDKGIGYTLGRTHMNSCDFSLENYACYESEADYRAERFDPSRTFKYTVPLMKAAFAHAESSGRSITLHAVPWSPPAFMKTNGNMNCGGSLKSEYRQAWADCFVRYIRALEREGIRTGIVSTQNEPAAVQRWDSCRYTAAEETAFVRDYLGPTLAAAGLGDIKILVWDHNKESVLERSSAAFDDRVASEYVWGAGFHWYSGDHFEQLSLVHERYPHKALLLTEFCVEERSDDGPQGNAEKYAHELIGDLNNFANGFIDWNLLLDEEGGPNHARNFCDAAVRTRIRAGKTELEFRPAYYYMGHFSKFIFPCSRRIAVSRFSDKLETCAFKRPDGKLVLVVLNRSDTAAESVISVPEYGIASASFKPHSIKTVVLP